jgi:chromosome segregation ATPase
MLLQQAHLCKIKDLQAQLALAHQNQEKTMAQLVQLQQQFINMEQIVSGQELESNQLRDVSEREWATKVKNLQMELETARSQEHQGVSKAEVDSMMNAEHKKFDDLSARHEQELHDWEEKSAQLEMQLEENVEKVKSSQGTSDELLKTERQKLEEAVQKHSQEVKKLENKIHHLNAQVKAAEEKHQTAQGAAAKKEMETALNAER